ncbi:MAG: NAD(P)/FAD-dependent oxidoreductase, partial [bacterium]
MLGPSVCVVGGGVVGLATAMHCAALGARVTVLEKEHLGAGSSSLSAGVVGNLSADELTYSLSELMVAFLPEAKARGVQMTQCGYGRLATTADHLLTFESWVELHRSHGNRDVQILDPHQLLERIPGYYCPDAIGAVIDTAAFYVDGHQLCHAYAAIARERGAEIAVGVEVVSVARRSQGLDVYLSNGNRLDADVVVNAAGPWAASVAKQLGQQLVVVPQRHQVCVANLPMGYEANIPAINEYIPGTDEYALYFRPEGSSQLLAGLHTDTILPDHDTEDPDRYNRGVDPLYIDMVAERLNARFPNVNMTITGGWAGLYPLTPDFKPIVGPYPDSPDIVTAAGFG